MQNRILLAAQKLSNWLVPLAACAIVAGFLYIAPPGILSKADAIGYAVCHRLDARSFHVDSRQLPLCARCSGMYLGAVIGIAFLSLRYQRSAGTPPKTVIAILVLFGLAFAVDGTNSYLYLMKSVYGSRLSFIPNLYTPNNTLRLLTGSGTGLGMAVAVFVSLNQTFWKNWDNKRVLGKPIDLLVLSVIMLLADLLVLTEWNWVLYPVAIISAGGVLMLLTSVYGMLWTMVMRQENLYMHLRDAWLPILAGLTITLLQITIVDVFRLWLTHTWGGFPLG
ncbi:MAG: DUF2085 domain-containing protein [Chloroflexi bacterium]|nr:DUF2085 domain-containing protein [Chloroflexota bacterium]